MTDVKTVEQSHTAIRAIVSWLAENKSLYHCTDKTGQEAMDRLVSVSKNISSATFGDCYGVLWNFYKLYDNNCIKCARGFFEEDKKIRSEHIDCGFVIVNFVFQGSDFKVPIPLGYINSINKYAGYREYKTTYIEKCKEDYKDYLEKRASDAFSGCRSVVVRPLGFNKKELIFKLLVSFALFFSWFIFIACLIIKDISTLPEIDKITYIFKNSSGFFAGVGHFYEMVSGISHNSFLGIALMFIQLFVFVMTVILIIPLRYYLVHINNDLIVSMNKKAIIDFKNKDSDLKLDFTTFKVEKENAEMHFKKWLRAFKVRPIQYRSYNAFLAVVVIAFAVMLLAANTGLNEIFFKSEKGVRAFFANMKLECNVFTVAKTDINIYEKADEHSLVKYQLPANMEYMKIEHPDNNGEFIRIKYSHKYGYSEGWMKSENFHFSAPYELMADYTKLGIESAEASTYTSGLEPMRIIDDNTNTSWRQEADMTPEAQSISLYLPSDNAGSEKVKIFGIAPGNCYSNVAFTNWGRPETLTFTFISGSKRESVTVSLDDGGYLQYYSLNRPVKADRIYITFDKTIAGEKSDNIMISEISLYKLNTTKQ